MYRHKVDLLDEASSRTLFRRCALLEKLCAPELQGIEAKILAACNGLPLALKVMGGLLIESRDPGYWEDALDALKSGNPSGSSEDQLQGVLQLSLQGLKDPLPQMFLDAVTVCRGQPFALVMAVWKAWYPSAGVQVQFKNLERRCLLGLDEQSNLVVHDVLVALGCSLIAEPDSRYAGSRVWTEDGRIKGFQADKQIVAARLEWWTGSRQQQINIKDWSEARIFILEGQVPWSEPPVMMNELLWLEASADIDVAQLVRGANNIVILRVADLAVS